AVYVSATPAPFEIENSVVGNVSYVPHRRERIGENETSPAIIPGGKFKPIARVSGSSEPLEKFDVQTKGRHLIVEQIIRPTGLLDPVVTIKPLKGQIDETIELCRQRIEKSERVLVTTLTKRTAEDLTDYLRNLNLKVRYLHSEIDAIERVEILRSLRAGEFDILVGINLLREGLDLPEVSLVCILDADKEGFLRSETSLLQTAGRAARHVNGEVVLFADQITASIQSLLNISAYRRERQEEHNTAHGITPQTVKRAVQESLHTIYSGREVEESVVREDAGGYAVTEILRELQAEMAEAAGKLEYERAALLRDQIRELKRQAGIAEDNANLPQRKVTYGSGKKRARKQAK
ncbi:MAG: helicase-related protein, partial [Roseimicrobium sp.]